MQDSTIDVGSYVAGKLGERIGRILNTHFTTGTGSGQPNGVVTAAASGKVGTTGQTTSIIFQDLLDLIASVDPAYQAGAKFMCNWSTFWSKIAGLKDSQNFPIFAPALAGGIQGPFALQILGYPVVINQDVASMAANAKSVLFGDFSKYLIRRVRSIEVLRLSERYAEAHQVGFLGFGRFDGDLIDAGTNPVKYYANSAT